MGEIAISVSEGKSLEGRKMSGRRRRGLLVSIIIGSIAVHVVALVLFGIWVIARYFSDPPAEFEVREILKIPPQSKEHKMNMAKHQALTSKPAFSDRILSQRPMDFALPDLPKVPVDQMLPIDPSELISDQVNALIGTAGLGVGLGDGLEGGNGSGEGTGFFGIKDQARSVVIMIDVSASMFGRTGDLDYSTGRLLREGKEQSFQIVRDEAFKLVDSLDIDMRFGIIRWSGSARAWQDQLVPATTVNKMAAKRHIQESVDANSARPMGGRPGGTRHDYALQELFKLRPEMAFMLSDGNATASDRGGREIPEKELLDIIETSSKVAPYSTRIHTIYYVTGSDKRSEEKMLRSLSRRTGGKFAKVKAGRRR
ncbi:MAG: VWA domain-containing protein [Verrucomicrobiaceae bacterium]|nr:VWA domain-containing protein [Verrucomicrobiaceae bacterium]